MICHVGRVGGYGGAWQRRRVANRARSFFIGPPCAGKRTVARLLHELYDFQMIELDHQAADADAFIERTLRESMSNWRRYAVIYPISSPLHLDRLADRPFFYLIAVDAPLLIRHAREGSGMSLADFARLDDAACFSRKEPTGAEVQVEAGESYVRECMRRANLLLHNCGSEETLAQCIREAKITDETRIRPSWTHYFAHMAHLAAQRSNCIKRSVGCVLVKNNRVVATGYNGTPRYYNAASRS